MYVETHIDRLLPTNCTVESGSHQPWGDEAASTIEPVSVWDRKGLN